MISVIVPAHDEAAVIGRCLAALTEGAREGELEVLVVCNGCRDDTAAIARGFGPPVRVLESEVASKNAALNLGHRTARGWPRFFVDADIVLPLEAVRKVAAVLEAGPALAATPPIRVDLSGRGWPVRAYYDVWLRTPYVTEGLLGSGVYALSEEGGRRLEAFPDIIADDAFVRLLFRPEERAIVPGCHFVMTPPETLRSLIHINVRRLVGRHEMAERHPEVTTREAAVQRGSLYALARRPRWWPALAVYFWAKVASLALFHAKRLRGREKEWNRDETSRRAAAARDAAPER